jgi:hypothetical protein
MYRRITQALRSSAVFASFDPFLESKQKSYTNAFAAIEELSALVVGVVPGTPSEQFDVLMQFSLW